MKNLIVGGLLAAAVVAGSIGSLAADKKDEKKEYPLKTCVVTDEKLGSMGKPHVIKHEGKEVQFCCKGCKKDFKKEPAKYLKKIDEASKKTK